MTVSMLKNQISTFAKRWEGVLAIVLGALLGQGLSVLTAPLLTRLYSPDDLGILSAYVAIVSTLVVIGSLRYDLAIPLPEEDETAIHLLIMSVLILLVITAVSGGIIYLFSDTLTARIGLTETPGYLIFLPLSLFWAGLHNVFRHWAIRRGAFTAIAKTKVHKSFSQAGIQVLTGYFGMGIFGLLLGDVVGRLSGTRSLIMLFKKDRSKHKPALSLTPILAAGKRYRRFPLISSSSGFLNVLGVQLPALVLTSLYGPAVTGWYALSLRVIGLPVTLVGEAVGQVYFSKAAKLRVRDPRGLRGLLVKTSASLFALGVVPFGLLIVLGPSLFSFVFGAEWQVAGVYARILGGMYLLRFSIVPISQTLNILERQDLQLGWDVFRLVSVIGTFLLARSQGYSAENAIGLYGGIMAVAYIVLGLMCFRCTSSTMNESGNRNEI